MEKRKKALLITNIPTPYRIPLFNEIRRQLDGKGWDFKVVFAALGYKRRKWEVKTSEFHFDFHILQSKALQWLDSEKVTFTYPGLFCLLRKENPDVIVTNAFSPATLKLWWLSHFKPIDYIIWSGAIVSKGRPENILRRLYRRMMVKRASAYIVYGSLAKKYLVFLGADPAKVTIGTNTVDLNFFKNETGKIREKPTAGERKRILYIGNLTKGKRLDLLLEAASELISRRDDFVIDLVGDGPERKTLMKSVEKLGLGESVVFHGFKQKSELPSFFARAFCFVFPSEYDIWGLVLIEAMSTGLPCLSSIHAGATCDMIPNGSLGFALDFSDVYAVSETLDRLLSDPAAAGKIGENARRFVEKHATIEKSAASFIDRIVENS